MESVPPPFIPRPTWFDDAACSGLDVNLFFPDVGENAVEATNVCRDCPVQEQCQEYGRDERYGVWGGVTARDRRTVARSAQHGSVWRYNRGCRCRDCASAKSRYNADRYALRVLEGGAA